jgi:hypothetical protein
MVSYVSNTRHKFHYWLLLALVILGYASQQEVSYLDLVLICNSRIIYFFTQYSTLVPGKLFSVLNN